MRRSVWYLAALFLIAGTGIRFLSSLPAETVVAQESSPDRSSPPRPSDPFVVPAAGEAAALVEFVTALKSLRLGPGPEQDEYHAKAPAAIRKACERILELDPDEASTPHRYARRELLTYRMADLAQADQVDAKQRQQIATDSLEILTASERLAEDAELATSLATTFEEFAEAEESRTFYQSLGDLFVKNSNEAIARRGEYLHGAARRLHSIGQPFELTGRTVDGQEFQLESLRGKVVLVYFWGTWCDHCRDQLPDLQQTYQSYHDRGFEVVGISIDDDPESLRPFLKKHSLPWTTLHDPRLGSEHPAAIRYGIAAYPTSFLLDREGNVVAVDLQGRKLNRTLAELCDPPHRKNSAYPVFNISEVIERLTSVGAKLHKDGKTKSDRDLREHLERQTVELDLPDPNEEVISDRELYRRSCESVFIVCSLYKLEETNEWQTSLATAFAVTRDGVLSSSCHVFDNEDEAEAIVVMDLHHNVYPVTELLAVNQKADTCLFRIDATDLKPLPLADDAPPGTRVRILGHPGDSFYFLSSGIVANYERDHDGIVWLNTTADFGQGSSGGPVLDDYGNVVGQVSRTFTLYAGGPATRGRIRRVAGAIEKDRRIEEPQDKPDAASDIPDPQMVFKACVPVRTLQSLVKPKVSPDAKP